MKLESLDVFVADTPDFMGWLEICSEATERQAPRLILDICQAIFDVQYPDGDMREAKLAIFRHVSAGRLAEAIELMLPAGFSMAPLPQPEEGTGLTVAGGTGVSLQFNGPSQLLTMLSAVLVANAWKPSTTAS